MKSQNDFIQNHDKTSTFFRTPLFTRNFVVNSKHFVDRKVTFEVSGELVDFVYNAFQIGIVERKIALGKEVKYGSFARMFAKYVMSAFAAYQFSVERLKSPGITQGSLRMNTRFVRKNQAAGDCFSSRNRPS